MTDIYTMKTIQKTATVFLLFFLLAIQFTGIAQVSKIDTVLSNYSEHYQPEKIHIHFDKFVYNKGETIWFKAYLMAGTELSDASKNFYVDFIDENGKLLKHFITPIFQSSAKGQFDIPGDYLGSFIHIRAYTQWMMNFDSSFHFTKDIIVQQNKTKKPTLTEMETSIHFFPEGGDMVEGLYSRIGFLAVNKQTGMPVDVYGAIKNSKGNLVDSFISQHDGMGSFIIEVQPKETYVAYWKDAFGENHADTLPAAKPAGISMMVQQIKNKEIIQIHRTNELPENFKTIYIVAQMNQHLVYRSKINLSDKTFGVAQIPVDNFPTGVLQVTALDANLFPMAERVAFINNNNHEFITDVNAAEKNLSKRGKNVIEISVPDSINTNLSVSITDAGLPTEKNDIIAQFLLCDDLKGYIHNPAYYFFNAEDSVVKNLDLVMLTHGWRRFNWTKAFAESESAMNYARDSDYIQLKGKMFFPSSIKVPEGQQIFLLLQAKDSSKQTLVLPVASDGSFIQHGAIFFDTLQVFYRLLGDKKLESRSELTFKNGFLPARGSDIRKNYSSPYVWSLNDSSAMQQLKQFGDMQQRLERLRKSTTLLDVTVEGKIRRSIDIMDKKYTSGVFSFGDGYQFDVVNDTRAQSSMSVFHYLQGMVPGLQMSEGELGGGWQLMWRNFAPELFIDEMHTDADMVYNLPMSDVAYIKVFRPPFFGSPGAGPGGAIAIYTKKGDDLKHTPGKGLNSKMLEGYSAYKQFYSPDYSGTTANFTPDTRSTLYWQPYLLTDKHNRKAKIEFYNNDISNRLRIIVEGFNADGKLTRTEKVIE